MRFSLRPLIAGFMLTLLTGVASANYSWHFSGFGTLSAMWQDNSDLFFSHPAKPRDDAGRPDFGADSLLGLQFSRRLGDRTDVTLQLLASDDYRRRQTPQVSWAFIRYSPSPGLTLRAGRLRAPFFMYSDSLSINFSHLWVRPPVEVYGLNPFSDLDGIDLLYQRRLGAVDVEVQPFIGKGKHTFPDGRADLSDIYGMKFTLTGENLAAQLGYARGRLSIRYGDPLFLAVSSAPGVDASRLSGSGADASFASFGLRWDDGTLQLIGEVARRHASRYVAPANGWHLTGAYRLGEFTPFVTLARQWQSTSVVAKSAAIPLLNEYLASRNNSQRSITLGMRWDPRPNTALKVQATRAKIDRDAWGAMFPRNEVSGNSPAGRTVDTLSLSLDFVF